MSIESSMIEQHVLGLGRGVSDEAVVVGSGAVALAFEGSSKPFRPVQDVDLTVQPQAYEYLRTTQPDWEEVITPDGAHLLRNGVYDIGVNWNDSSLQALRDRSWQTVSGVNVASLADVHIYKQARHKKQDAEDITYIRDQLQDPHGVPLDARILAREIATVQAALPESLQDAEERAIHLAANGLHIINTLYGRADIGRVGRIVGAHELPEYAVPATYHNGFGLPRDMRLLQQHFTNIGASDIDRLVGLVADAYSDSIYGNGRYSDNPGGHDELLAARLAASHARAVGYDAPFIEHVHTAILGTTFDEQTKAQRGTYDSDPVVRAVAGIDLQPLCEADFAERTFDLIIEDGFSARFSPARTIGRIMLERGVRVDSTFSGLQAIDAYAHATPIGAPDGPTAIQALAHRLSGNASFAESHIYPEGWTLDNLNTRREHAAFFRELGHKLLASHGAITAVEAYALAKEHTEAMKKKHELLTV